jgi:4-diphosphocytidyl-2-C-methyl-D-erythritol kinase
MVIRRACCKINLVLDVIARRGDGYHDLDSLLVPVDWHDLVGVTVTPTHEAGASLRVSGPLRQSIPHDSSNIALRAAGVLTELSPEPVRVDVWLDKSVPSAAGLGGGSADAAAVLRSGGDLLRARGISLDEETLSKRALALGSDVPALLAGGAQRVRGRGETLDTCSLPAPLHLVIAVAGASSTAAAYAALREAEIGASQRVELAVASLGGGELDDSMFGSALEAAALRTSRDLHSAVERLRALSPERCWHLTGSGGALFCMVADDADAQALAASVSQHGFRARACRTTGSGW